LSPSCRKAQFDFGAVSRIDGGKIAERWVTWDNIKIFSHSATFRVAKATLKNYRSDLGVEA
jgi:hypothetical protein